MVPPLIPATHAPSNLFSPFLASLPTDIPAFIRGVTALRDASHPVHTLFRRAACENEKFDPNKPKDIVFACLIPALVLLSGLFAGLTLGYMSLDETQLKVLAISGTPKQREYAKKIQPIRKNGHLLLVTLLLGNMIVNETLPVISDSVLGGGFQGVVVSTVLIVIFAEIIPQSLFTRHGLYLGAKMAGFTRCLIFFMGIIAWPVAKLLEFVLGPHHGIIYRRTELKELIAMHSSHATHGGDLKTDTVAIIGATLDLQEKVVKQAMTPINDVFMLDIESKLDYDLLKKICQTGHSRVPVYEEVDVPVSDLAGTNSVGSPNSGRTRRVKKILGILLVKQCILLDPKDATPLRKIPLNKVPFVPNNEPLLGILDKFQEGRSHMAIVSRFSVEKAASVKKAVKRGLTQRLRERVMGDSDSSDEDEKASSKSRDAEESTLKEDGQSEKEDGFTDQVLSLGRIRRKKHSPGLGIGSKGRRRSTSSTNKDLEMGVPNVNEQDEIAKEKSKALRFQLPKAAASMASMSMLEQSMPADAVLAKEGAEEFLQNFDPAVMPLGIITLEDVLEELIGEEIYDEFDPQGAHGDPYEVPPAQSMVQDYATSITTFQVKGHDILPVPGNPDVHPQSQPTLPPLHAPNPLRNLSGLGFLRSKSAPPVPRDGEGGAGTGTSGAPTSPPTPNPGGGTLGDRLAVAAHDAVEEHDLGHQHNAHTIEGGQLVPLSSTSTLRVAAPSTHIPIEAVLLGRGRKPAGAGAGGGGGGSGTNSEVPSRAASVAPGGGRSGAWGSKFKSSPLQLGDVEKKEKEKEKDGE